MNTCRVVPAAPRVLPHALLVALVFAPGCDSRAPSARTPAPRANVLADSSAAMRLEVRRPAGTATPASPVEIAPERAAPGPPAVGDAAPGNPLPAEVPASGEPGMDPSFKPPILRFAPKLRVPSGAAGGDVTMELRVEADGSVGSARWAAGVTDTACVRAARECALGMRFYAARRAGEPVVAWSRRRFEFSARR
jgi:hypothetical protein